MKDGLDFLRDEKFWYKPHGTGRPMRHKVAAQAYDEIERLTKMTAAMESVMSKIGEHFKVKPGDVAGLFEAIETQSAEGRRRCACVFEDGKPIEICKYHGKLTEELSFLMELPVRNEDWEGYAVAVRAACRRALATDSGSPETFWRSDQPTEPRWYWWRQGDRIEPARVISVEGILVAQFIGENQTLEQVAWQPDWLWADMNFPIVDGRESS